MTIQFTNHCKYAVVLNVVDGERQCIPPFETAAVVRDNSDGIQIFIKRNCESYSSKGLFTTTIYHLILETEYHFAAVPEGETFHISREKIQISHNASYDRLFLQAANASCLSETHKIASESGMKKAFNKSRRFDFIFDTFMTAPLFSILLILAGIFLTVIWGWKIALLYFPIIFLCMGLLNWSMDKLWNMFSKKVFNQTDEKAEFYSYFENDFITNFYMNSTRTPYMGGIETD